jgi:superfamily II DNA or RNA helicase
VVLVRARSYQQQLIDGAIALWRAGHRRIAAVLATGGGKTIVFSHLAEMALRAERPVLVLAHRTELLDQAIDKLTQVAPHRRIGRMDGTTKQYRAEVVVGSVQTCSTDASLALLRMRQWGLIVVDETHHVAATTYLKVLRALGAYDDSGPLVLGVTATLGRTDGQALGQIFEAVVEPRIGLIDLIRHPEGPFLVPPRGIRIKIDDLNLDRVRRTAGDFNGRALGAAMSEAMAPKRIIEAWQEHAAGRPTLAFLPSVALSQEQAQAFRDAGISAIHLDGTTPKGDAQNPAPGTRRWAIAEYMAGRITVLCNVDLFTEGTDLPLTSCVILGSPTSSTGKYQQQVGRGLRLHPGKSNCVVLDACGSTGRHKLATMASLDGADSPEDTPDDLLMYEIDETQEEDFEEEEKAPREVTYADGDLTHELVDLFGASHTAWLRTRGGRWFVPAGAFGFLFLRPLPGDRYDLVGVTPGGEMHGFRHDMEIGYAMAAGDEIVAANPIWQANRNAAWRSERRDARVIERASALIDR